MSVNKASTFNGFCSFHDGALFRELDVIDLTNPQLFFWELFYRSTAFELFQKAVALDFSKEIRRLDKGMDRNRQIAIQFEADVHEYSHGEGLAGTSELLRVLETMRASNNFDGIFYKCYMTDRVLPFAGIGCFQPCRDINGKFLQRVNLIFREELFKVSRRPHSVCMARYRPKKGRCYVLLH